MTHEKGILTVNEQTCLPRGELWFEYSHSGGPGGQNVNKVSSRVTACLNLDHSPSFTEEQKSRIRTALRGRINREGILRITCEESRSQAFNREAAVTRLLELLAASLRRHKKRKASRPTLASRTKRLTEKKQRATLKRDRKTRPED